MLDSADVRRINKNKIRSVMRSLIKATKQEIAIKTGLSVATCNTLLNELEKEGEVIGEKKLLHGAGRNAVVYHINEAYESILCISLEIHDNKRTYTEVVLSAVGNIKKHVEITYDYLPYDVIQDRVETAVSAYPNITQIMITLPSVVEGGIARYCDISELNDIYIAKRLEDRFQIPAYMENDMYCRVYGYYKKCRAADDIVTLAYFPSHILPGSASIHAGTLIKGKNRFAGTVSFLPFGMDKEQQLSLLKKSTCLPIIVKAVCSIIALINPHVILLTGDLLEEEVLLKIYRECSNVIPEEYMPELLYEKDMYAYYIEGMYQKALELKGIL